MFATVLLAHRKASHPGTHGSSPVEPLSEDLPAASYDAVYNLVTNEEHILPADLFQYKKVGLFTVWHSWSLQFVFRAEFLSSSRHSITLDTRSEVMDQLSFDLVYPGLIDA